MRGLALLLGGCALAGCSADPPAPPADRPTPGSAAAATRLAALRALFPGALARAERGPARASVDLPAAASGPVRVVDRASGMAVSFTLAGASAAAPGMADGLALYPGGAPGGGDLVHRVSPAGVEDLAVLPHAPEGDTPELRYLADVGAAAGLRLVEGTLELCDAGGAPRLRVSPPWLVDAGGARRAASLALEGCAADRSPRAPWGRPVTPPAARSCTVVVRFSDEGLRYPVLVDPQWVSTGAMATARSGPTVTVLNPADPASLVLVAGGLDASGNALASAELYEPLGRVFAHTGAMTAARAAHTATRLAAAGPAPVLVAGGVGSSGAPLASTERYDVGTGVFTADAPMNAARRDHTATLYTDGKVLLAGGAGAAGVSLASAEVYTLGSPAIAVTGAMARARAGHADALLGSGHILITGGLASGFAQQAAEVYDPQAGAFSPIAATGGGSPNLTAARAFHTATVLPSGAVLIAGGTNDAAGTLTWDTAELYLDGPASRGFQQPVAQMTAARVRHTAALLPSGDVLLAGGFSGQATLAGTEVWSAASSTFAASLPMAGARRGHGGAVVNAGGSTSAGRGVFVVGGLDAAGNALAAAEILIRGLGDACALDAECASGHCTVGLCCDQACTEACRSCTAAGKGSGADGVCGNIAAGTDAGVSCTNAIQVQSVCDANGNPVQAMTKDCKPSGCAPDGTFCVTFCSDSIPCSATGYCVEDAGAEAGIPDDAGPGAGVCLQKGGPGAPCAASLDGGDCQMGPCTDGVCCNSHCANQCEACDVPDHVGSCYPVGSPDKPEQPHGSRPACPGDGTMCQGICNGSNSAVCFFPNLNADCDASTCTCSGAGCAEADLVSSVCQGDGVCFSGAHTCQGGLRCAPDAGACLPACALDHDCVGDLVCDPDAGACGPLDGGRCDQDDGGVLRVGGQPNKDCAPYRCPAGATACLARCATVDDCAEGLACDPSGKCLAAPKAPLLSCALGGAPGGAGWGLALAGVMVAAARRRRRSFGGATRPGSR